MQAPRAMALCHFFEGALDFQAGKWEAAERSIRESIELYRNLGSASGESLGLQRLGVLWTARGKLGEAWDALNEGVVVAERAAMRSHCLTRLYASMMRNRLATDDRQGLELSLAAGLEAARRHGHCVTCNALLLPELVRCHVLRGELDEAEHHAAQLDATANEFESRAWTAMAAHARARVERARGRHAQASQLFDKARQAYLSVEQPYEAARCARAQAASLKAQRKNTRAKALRDQAAELFGELGAPALED